MKRQRKSIQEEVWPQESYRLVFLFGLQNKLSIYLILIPSNHFEAGT